MGAVYAVRVGGVIAKRGGNRNRRRRAGIEFGPDDKLVAVGGGDGAVDVTEDQLDAIKGDPYLRAKEVSPPAVQMPAAATAPAPEEDAAASEPEEEAAPEEQPVKEAPELPLPAQRVAAKPEPKKATRHK